MASSDIQESKVKRCKFFCPQTRRVVYVANVKIARLVLGCNTCTICDGCKEIGGEN